MNVIAYGYNSALHCPRCSLRTFPDIANAKDHEGNPVNPMFADADTSADYCDDCGHAIGNAPAVIRVLSIDAWNGPNGWEWNNWYRRGFVPAAWLDLSPRALLAKLRGMNCLPLPAPGHAALDDDGHNLLIVMRGTREPILVLEYGEGA